MTDTPTINPDQLPPASAVPADMQAVVFSPGGPLQKLPFEMLLAKLIATDLVSPDEATLQTTLGYDADKVALVNNDPDPFKNGWWRKVGASGAGDWAQFETLSLAVKDAAAANAVLAGLYANAQDDGDIAGGAPGERGARFWRDRAVEIVAAAGISIEELADVVAPVRDANGRWWVQDRPDGTRRIQKPCDAKGNRMDLQIAALSSRADVTEELIALLPPVPHLRLKKSLYSNPLLLPRQVSPVDPIVVGAYGTNVSTMTSPVAIAITDPRIRLFSGKWQRGTGTPGSSSFYGQANTNGAPSGYTGGLPNNWFSNEGDIDFILPAGQAKFELVLIGQGALGNFFVDIDGIGTNVDGYPAPPSSGGTYYVPITLAPSGDDRHVRITLPGRPFTGITVETSGTIKAYAPQVLSSIAFMGDSITQGAVATATEKKWERIVARKLGIDNAINLGVGGSGYRKRYPAVDCTCTIVTGSNHVSVVTGALAVGDFFDCPAAGIFAANVTTGAGAGGVAIIDANATTSVVGAAASSGTGYNYLQRIDDVLTAVDGGLPDAVVIAGGGNDTGVNGEGLFDAAATAEQARLVCERIRAASADIPIIIISPFCGYTTTDYTFLATVRDAIFAAVSGIPRVHTIDVEGMATLDNRDIIWNRTANGPHPLDAGHAIYAVFIALRIAAIINSY